MFVSRQAAHYRQMACLYYVQGRTEQARAFFNLYAAEMRVRDTRPAFSVGVAYRTPAQVQS